MPFSQSVSDAFCLQHEGSYYGTQPAGEDFPILARLQRWVEEIYIVMMMMMKEIHICIDGYMDSKENSESQGHMSCIDVVCKKDGERGREVLFMLLGAQGESSECLASSIEGVNHRGFSVRFPVTGGGPMKSSASHNLNDRESLLHLCD